MLKLSRRRLVGGAGAAFVGAASAHGELLRTPSLRVVHMTDFHVQPELNAAKGMEMALHHALHLDPKLVLCGGDCVMDSWSQTEARTKLQWSIFNRLRQENVKVPFHSAIGNHDVWGWNKKDSQTTGLEARYGKKWFLDNFGYAETHHSFDQGGWHFVVLDNIWHTPDGYNGILGDEQREWLAEDLSRTKAPTLVMSHIPLLSVTALVDNYNDKSGEWNVGGSEMTKDLRQVQAIFEKNPHVKIALSGHMHTVDRVDWKGVSYLCSGAVSGNWWKGALEGYPPGYRALDLFPDGTFTERYQAWGWTPSFLS